MIRYRHQQRLPPHVFDRFRQADASTTRVHGGLGLGLSIVHQPSIFMVAVSAVHSERRKAGATFTITLPFVGLVSNQPEAEAVLPAQNGEVLSSMGCLRFRV